MSAMKLWSRDFIGITLINFFLFCSFQMIQPSISLHAHDIGASDAMVGLILAIFTVSSLIMRPLAGTLLDRIGRHGVFLTGLAAITALMFGYGFTGSVLLLITLRFLHGFAWGATTTASSTIAADVIPRRRFGEGMGYFSLSTALALAIAPAIGLQIHHMISFKATAIVATVLVAIAFFMSHGLHYQPPQARAPGEPVPFPYEKGAIRAAVMMFFITATMGAVSNFVALYSATVGIDNIASFFVVYAVFMLVSRPMIGKIIDRRGFNIVVAPSLVLMGIALVVLHGANSLLDFLIAAATFGTGFAAAQTVFQTMAVISSPRHRTGAANATFFTGFDGGIGFGSLIAGIIAGRIGFDNMYLVFVAFLIVAAILYVLLGRGQKRITPPDAGNEENA